MYHEIAAAEIERLSARAKAANLPMAHVLREAGLAKTTWYRGGLRGHALPRISTLERIDRAITSLLEKQAASPPAPTDAHPSSTEPTTNG